MNKENFEKRMEEQIEKLCSSVKTPRLLLHACCAPCLSACLEYLGEYFEVTLFYYNPNIFPEAEYEKRVQEVKRLVRELPTKHKATVLEGAYEPEKFFELARGLEKLPEGGGRCERCFRLRLAEAALEAKKGNFDAFTTTLSISPLKNAETLNRIGIELSEAAGVPYLVSDFKKKDRYKRSIELSKEYGLYRQNFCGCVYSKEQAE